jgi:hypothetical protein
MEIKMKKLIAACLVLMFCSVAFATTLLPEKQNTGTDLDNILFVITNDEGLVANTTEQDRERARASAHEMNKMILTIFQQTGAFADGIITVEEVFNWNVTFRQRAPRDRRMVRWMILHGDDEDGTETGYHLVQNDGATWNLYGENAINTVFDGIYHMGFVIVDENNVQVSKTFYPDQTYYFRNEDGDRNASLSDVAAWLNMLLAEDLEKGF